MKALDSEHEQIARHARYLRQESTWLMGYALGAKDEALVQFAQEMAYESDCWAADYAGTDWPPRYP